MPINIANYIEENDYYVIIVSLCLRNITVSKPLLIYAFKQDNTLEEILQFISYLRSTHWYFGTLR